jgi:heptaprenyl diphosphate synthase
MQRFSDNRRRLAFFGALCLFLSTVEFLIPKPLPIMRLGLANLPVLLALRFYPPGFILALVGLKIFGQGLVNGTFFSYIFIFSAAGSLASGLTMLGLSRAFGPSLSLVGTSLFGALASNMTQILLARYYLLGEGAWLIGPPFLVIGTVTGFVLGVFAEKMRETSTWLRSGEENP